MKEEASEESSKPLCFVLMPFGKKGDGAGGTIDFDAVYEQILKPAVIDAGLEPIRADEEKVGGIIHKPMFERLVLCDYAVADLTTANANVFYELGVRHAVRPYSTVLVFAKTMRLPFDLGPMRGLPYDLSRGGKPTKVKENREALRACLTSAKDRNIDSPLFQLVEGMKEQSLARDRTDTFRQQVNYSQKVKDRLARARKAGAEEVAAVKASLGPLKDRETGVLVDLLLSFRAVEAWDAMIDLVDEMPKPVANLLIIQEQLAFALNRAGRGEEAERILLGLIKERGASSETNGLLGRVYKDRWDAAKQQGNTALAQGELEKAVEAYLKGFEADWRDAFPGINAATLMEVSGPADPRRKKLLPLVRYAAERRIAGGEPDYWDHATLLEVAVLENDRAVAASARNRVVAAVREPWEPKTTARNLGLIREARAKRGEDVRWIEEIEADLAKAARKSG